jgi:hypothetical protein
MSRRVSMAFAGSMLALALAAGPAAAGNPSGSGQPNASCEDEAMMPPGFASGGFANADLHYAGNGVHSLNAASSHAVSQYDVACYQVTVHH